MGDENRPVESQGVKVSAMGGEPASELAPAAGSDPRVVGMPLCLLQQDTGEFLGTIDGPSVGPVRMEGRDG